LSKDNIENNPNNRDHQDISPSPNKEHLDLKREKGKFHKKTPPIKISYKIKPDMGKFYKEQIIKLNQITDNFQKQNKEYGKYFESKLLFKIKTDPKKPIIEENFRKDLGDAGIEIISAAQSKEGEWLGYTKESDFGKLKQRLKNRAVSDTPTFIDAFEEIIDVPKEDKIGPSLLKRPFRDDESVASLDVELQIIDTDDRVVSLPKFLNGFRQYISDHNGKVSDELITEKTCLLRIKADKELFQKLLENKRVTLINRSPILEFTNKEVNDMDLLKQTVVNSPSEDVHGILIMDSGIVEHPILKPAIREVFAAATKRSTRIRSDRPNDDEGHGTMVSSIALYGDVEKCRLEKTFTPEIKISSSKILFKDATGMPIYDEDELVEQQLKYSVEKIKSTQPKCKVINLSIGNPEKSVYDAKKQFILANVIDELAFRYDDLIFVVAAGNNYELLHGGTYPKHLLTNSRTVRITDPGTSAHAITVGSLRNYDNEINMNKAIYPSIFTRIGPGYKDMIKPELTEFGGDRKHDIIGAHYDFLHGNPFAKDAGTSMSTPMISHHLAKLMNRFPNAKRNLIKALLIASAEIPENKPSPIPKLMKSGNGKPWIQNLNIYGYGKPIFENAIFSDDKRVLLKHEGKIGLDQDQFFQINLPANFLTTRGRKDISITLVFDPPTDREQTSYLGAIMDFKLFMNKPVEKIEEKFSVSIENMDEPFTPHGLEKFEIHLLPGSRKRTKGVHIKGHVTYTNLQKNPKIDLTKPLVLVVMCKNRWIKNESYEQNYALVVTIKHSELIDLYNQIKNKNQIQISEDVALKQRAQIR